MEFSYFTSAAQPYQFFGLTHTPSSTQNGQLHEFRTAPLTDQYGAAFAAPQQSFHDDPASCPAQSHQSSQPAQIQGQIHGSMVSLLDMEVASGPVTEVTPPEPLARSSSEENDLLLSESRRKVQNRMAQRESRKRKEKYLKDLEAKLTSIQCQSRDLNNENEWLRNQLAKIATGKNEILRAMSDTASNGPILFMGNADELVRPLDEIPTDHRSKDRSPASCVGSASNLSSKYDHFGAVTTINVKNDTEEPLLGVSATWDYIRAQELFRKGLVDVGDVYDRLKKMARCEGKGPIFLQSDVRQAISESAVAGGRDELI